MKRFILHLSVILIPVILLLAGWEILMRKGPHAFRYKRDVVMENCRKNGRFLVLGSSHSYYGVKTDCLPGAYNLSFVSQNLMQDRVIFETFLAKPQKLEYVVVPVSVFSFFENTEKVPAWRRGAYVRYWGFPEKNFLEKFFIFDNMPHQLRQYIKLQKKIRRKGARAVFNLSPTGWGEDQPVLPRNKGFQIAARKAARRHLAGNLNNITCFYELKKIISLAQNNNIKVILFTPPALPCYWKNISRKQERKMRELIAQLKKEPGVFYIDLMRSGYFKDKDFGDADHLAEKGAEKLARLLYKFARNSGK